MAKRENKRFTGVVSDKELYMLEDGLLALIKERPETKKQAYILILKLYKFWET